MADHEKYKDLTDHDLSIHTAVQVDGILHQLTKLNGKIESSRSDIVRLKVTVAVIIAGSGVGITKILTLIGG